MGIMQRLARSAIRQGRRASRLSCLGPWADPLDQELREAVERGDAGILGLASKGALPLAKDGCLLEVAFSLHPANKALADSLWVHFGESFVNGRALAMAMGSDAHGDWIEPLMAMYAKSRWWSASRYPCSWLVDKAIEDEYAKDPSRALLWMSQALGAQSSKAGASLGCMLSSGRMELAGVILSKLAKMKASAKRGHCDLAARNWMSSFGYSSSPIGSLRPQDIDPILAHCSACTLGRVHLRMVHRPDIRALCLARLPGLPEHSNEEWKKEISHWVMCASASSKSGSQDLKAICWACDFMVKAAPSEAVALAARWLIRCAMPTLDEACLAALDKLCMRLDLAQAAGIVEKSSQSPDRFALHQSRLARQEALGIAASIAGAKEVSKRGKLRL